MKKAIRFLTMTLLAGLLLASCDSDDSSPDVGTTAVAFAPVISGAQATPRASDASWAVNDAIGVFMTAVDQPLSGSNLADNVKYTTTGGAGFSTTTPIYYPLSGNVDFVAYYPYRATPNPDPYIYKVDVSNQASPAAIDLLYSNNAVNKAKSKSAVALEFDHKLSRMVLNIKAGEGMTAGELTGVTVKITDMPTKADFSLADGTFSNEAGIATAITPIVATTTSGFVATYTAIVVPQAVSAWSGRKMVFTVGDDAYEYAIPDADDFATGKSYTYTVTISKTGISVTRGTITDWTTTIPEDIVAEQIPIPQTVKIPKGTFIMGSPTSEPNRDSDETQHKVTLTKDFYISKYQVTFAQYDAFCEATSRNKPSDSNWGRDDRPVINVTWHDAVAYCEWLSEQTGQTWTLPTEAQWEYACRGGKANHPFGIGTGTKLTGDMANFNGRYIYNNGHQDLGSGNGIYLAQTQLVGSYAPNAWGLYDMHGNVWEWCSDWYDSKYGSTNASDAATDPIGPTTGTDRVLRGGSWRNYAQFCRSAYRNYDFPAYRFDDVGFRVVFVP